MKKLYSTVIVILLALFSFANPVNNSVPNNGDWKINSTWSLDRVPSNGDTVIIPADKIVVIDNIENLTTDFLYIKIYGTLKFTNGKLWLNDKSSVVVFLGGSIQGTGSSSETLRIGGFDKFSGSIDGAILGPVSASKTTGSSPFGFSSFSISPLPVKFIGFNLAHQNNDVLVQWLTAEEVNTTHYEIQRSENGTDWTTIANIAAAVNNMPTHSYSYTDKNITSRLAYYRILQADIDGRFVVTAVRMIKNENGTSEIKVNTTASNSIYVHFSDQVKASVVVRLISSNGRVISQKTFAEPVGQVMMPAPNAIQGVYIVTVTDGQNLKFSRQVLL